MIVHTYNPRYSRDRGRGTTVKGQMGKSESSYLKNKLKQKGLRV
jgi:hypothetical protein